MARTQRAAGIHMDPTEGECSTCRDYSLRRGGDPRWIKFAGAHAVSADGLTIVGYGVDRTIQPSRLGGEDSGAGDVGVRCGGGGVRRDDDTEAR